jgi:hypothetical protein
LEKTIMTESITDNAKHTSAAPNEAATHLSQQVYANPQELLAAMRTGLPKISSDGEVTKPILEHYLLTNKDESSPTVSVAKATLQHFDDITALRDGLPNHAIESPSEGTVSLKDVQILNDMLQGNSSPYISNFDEHWKDERIWDAGFTGAWCGMTALSAISGVGGGLAVLTGALCVAHLGMDVYDSSQIGSQNEAIPAKFKLGKDAISNWSEFKSRN